MKKRIGFRADGNSQIGLGHIYRLLSLSQLLKDNFYTVFIIYCPSQSITTQIKNVVDKILILSKNDDLYSPDETETYINEIDILVTDGYKFNSEFQQYIKSKQKKLICIDDIFQFNFFADVVINHAIGVSQDLYNIQPYTKLCLGTEYLMLRQEFYEVKKQNKPITSINKVLICFGGADPDNYTLSCLKLMVNCGYSDISVIIGSVNTNEEELINYKNALQNIQIRFYVDISAREVIDLIQNCDLMVTSPSTISYEACMVGIPLIIFKTAENQQKIAEGLLYNKCAIMLPDPAKIDSEINRRFLNDLNAKIDVLREVLKNQTVFFNDSSKFNLRNIFNELNY